MGSREENIRREGGREGGKEGRKEGGWKREGRIIAHLFCESQYTCREGAGYIKECVP